ncbi:F-box only protein 21-like isoform X2 [Rhinatrema bivittatum]|uniref:F-box only protein 21-like isoform X2 n=1 Tax=Rhinatrema bivittatum TaxID=194408 RepID=UPI00112958E0|nr:F-box only protein 21-like isoform X2 [Rhinatrema bivittatum]
MCLSSLLPQKLKRPSLKLQARGKEMPQINSSTILQICLLLFALSAQYFISQYYGADSAERLHIIQRVTRFWSHFRKSYLSLDAWLDKIKLWISKAKIWYQEKAQSSSDHIVEEDAKAGYFAESPEIRSPKPAFVQFSVGQVIVHRRLGYSGVIIGWDATARAPEEWLREKYPSEKQDVRDTPHYRILINRANRFGQSSSYIPEDEITIIMGLQVIHPDLKIYFSKYDGAKYIMQPWMKRIYPHD